MEPDTKNDLSKRVDDFNAELKTILGKYQLELYAEARIDERGHVVADPRVREHKPKAPESAPVSEAPAA